MLHVSSCSWSILRQVPDSGFLTCIVHLCRFSRNLHYVHNVITTPAKGVLTLQYHSVLRSHTNFPSHRQVWSIDQQYRHCLGACCICSISGHIPDWLNHTLNFTASPGGSYAMKLFVYVYSEEALSLRLFFLQVTLLHKYYTHTGMHAHTWISAVTSFVFLLCFLSFFFLTTLSSL